MGWLKCSGIRICYLARCDWHHSPRRPASKSRHQAVRKDSSAHHQTVGPHSTCAMLALVCSLFVVRQQHSTTSNFSCSSINAISAYRLINVRCAGERACRQAGSSGKCSSNCPTACNNTSEHASQSLSVSSATTKRCPNLQ